ncbi:MAG: zinc ABC transporter substrate-binding protein [Rickettsiaceae bacterium]|nr:zinc ABC transporter substrate-binding protein [Rickettsiaceae bacterium]
MKLVRFFTTLLFLSFSLNVIAKQEHKLNIVTSSSPIASIFYMVLGDVGKLEYLAKNHGCAHDYNMQPSQLKLIKNADIIAYIDDNFDGFIIQSIQQNSAYIMKFSTLPLHLLKNENGSVNWHLWLKTANVRLMLQEILNVLVKVAPEHSEEFVDNYHKALKNLDLLDMRVKNLGETKNILLLADSLEYLFDNFKISPQKIFLGHKQPTLKYVNDIRGIFTKTEKTCLVIDNHQSDEYYTNILNNPKVNIISLNAENWTIPKDVDKKQIYYGQFQLMLNSIRPCF